MCQTALLGFGTLRLYDLRDARGAHFRKYQIIGWRRKLHRLAKLLCCLAAAIPLLQLNGRLAEVTFSHYAAGIAPFEMLGASRLSCCAMHVQRQHLLKRAHIQCLFKIKTS